MLKVSRVILHTNSFRIRSERCQTQISMPLNLLMSLEPRACATLTVGAYILGSYRLILGDRHGLQSLLLSLPELACLWPRLRATTVLRLARVSLHALSIRQQTVLTRDFPFVPEGVVRGPNPVRFSLHHVFVGTCQGACHHTRLNCCFHWHTCVLVRQSRLRCLIF